MSAAVTNASMITDSHPDSHPDSAGPTLAITHRRLGKAVRLGMISH